MDLVARETKQGGRCGGLRYRDWCQWRLGSVGYTNLEGRLTIRNAIRGSLDHYTQFLALAIIADIELTQTIYSFRSPRSLSAKQLTINQPLSNKNHNISPLPVAAEPLHRTPDTAKSAHASLSCPIPLYPTHLEPAPNPHPPPKNLLKTCTSPVLDLGLISGISL